MKIRCFFARSVPAAIPAERFPHNAGEKRQAPYGAGSPTERGNMHACGETLSRVKSRFAQ